jgi:hypothetical protein
MEYGSRVDKTIIIGASWIVFVALFLAFNPAKLGFWQNIGAFIASGAIVSGLIALTWTKIASC